MMPLTLSLPLVLADADADTAVVPGMASVDPCRQQRPCDLRFHGSSRIADTAHDRGAADPSRPRKHWPGYWPAWVWDPARAGQPRGAVLSGWCLATAARRISRVPATCRRPFSI